MVDFQSRDTRRGISDDGDESDEADDEASDETGADQSDESDPSGETGGADTETAATDADGEPTDTDHHAADAASSDTPDPLGEEMSPDSETTSDTDVPTGPGSSAGGAAGSKVATGSPQAGADQSSPTPAVRPVDVALVTVGTTTGQGEDPTGEALATAIESVGHSVTARERLRGDYDGIQQAVDTLVGRDDVEVVVTAGGVGIEPSEATIEAVHPLFEKALPGFGEAFRTLLFEHIGTGIVAVRATAGIADGTPVFCLPADAEAATLAVTEIIATEAPELVGHLQ